MTYHSGALSMVVVCHEMRGASRCTMAIARRRSHSGITRLYQNVRLNGYQILFLSSRAIAQVRSPNPLMRAWHDRPAAP